MTQIGILSLTLYYGASTLVWGKVVARILPLSRAWSRIFGFLLGFYLSALAAGIPVVLWGYEQWLTGVIFLMVLIAGLLLSFLRPAFAAASAERAKQESSFNTSGLDPLPMCIGTKGRGDDRKECGDDTEYLPAFNRWQFLLLGALSVLFVYLLARARTGDYILSPWDTLSPLVLVVFFIMTFLVVSHIFSKHPVKIVLAVIIIFSYLTHLYLPLVYKTGFGGDKWRHLGAERWLQSGQVGAPAKHAIVWGEEKGLERLLAVDKISYTPMWTATVFIAESLGVDVFWVDLLLVFFLWSFFLPLILYQFGRLIFSPRPEKIPSPFQGEGRVMVGREVVGERLGLLLAFLPILFANFQTEGAITLPVSFSQLFFFFVLLLWAYFVKTGRRSTLIAASLLTLFSYWGYVLNFIVLIIAGALALCIRAAHKPKPFWLVVFAAVAAVLLPFLEVGHGLSKWGIGFFPFTAFINFIYHPTVNITVLPIIVAALMWIAVFWGLYRTFRSHRDNQAGWFLGIIFVILLASYFISWTFTAGEHILGRRLPETIVFLAVLFLGWGIISARDKINLAARERRGWATVAIVVVLAFIATSTYSSGPTSELVTSDQLTAAELVWSDIRATGPPYCVIANTWPLLALGSVSGERVIGGGFPIVPPNYQQPERVRIFSGLSQNPKMEWFDEAFAVTGAFACYYLNEPRWLNRIAASNTTYLLGPPRRVGEVYIWRVILDNSLEKVR